MTPIRKETAPGDIIAAIDHATGCQQCGKDLAGSVSDDFCSEMCQRTWQAARVGAEAELEDEAWPCAEWGVSAATAAEYLATVMRQVSATFTIADVRSDMGNEYGPDFMALFDAEREAAAAVFEAHRIRLDALRQRAESRAEGYAEAFRTVLRNL